MSGARTVIFTYLFVAQVDRKRYRFLMVLVDTLTQVKDEIDLDLEAAGVAVSSTSFIITAVLSGIWLDLVLSPVEECAVLPPSPDEYPEEGKRRIGV